MPAQAGTFPLTTTLVLRLQNLLWGSDYAPLAKQDIDTLLTIPRLSVSDSSARPLVHHFVRFSIEYLRRMGLVDETGRPKNLYGTVSALYSTEPANFALVALFRSGELHRITAGLDTDPNGTIRELLTVLASLFGNVYRRKQDNATLRTSVRNSTSLMVLPPLPKGIVRALQEHESAITLIFSTMVREYAQQRSVDLGPDDTLPLSDRKVVTEDVADSAFASKLRQTEIPHDGRSSFVATSGYGDVFSSTKELVNTTRAGVELQRSALPSLVAPVLGSEEHQLDAYAVDFFRHGSLEVLIRDNGIEVSEPASGACYLWALTDGYRVIAWSCLVLLARLQPGARCRQERYRDFAPTLDLRTRRRKRFG